MSTESLVSGSWQLDQLQVEGAVLTGLFRPSRRPDAPWLFVFGGNADGVLQGNRDHAELILGDRDLAVVTFAYRGFAPSTGIASDDAYASDTLTMWRHVQQRHGLTADRMHVVGFSTGACCAGFLGEHLAAQGLAPASISMLSPGMVPPRVPSWKIRLHRGPLQMRGTFARTPGPILMVCANQDSAFPVRHHASAIRKLLGERLTRYVELDGDHGAPLSHPTAVEAIRSHIGIADP